MKSLTAPWFYVIASLVAFALAGCKPESSTGIASVADASGAHCDSAAPYTLVVKDADGRRLRLVHSAGGWRYQPDQRTARDLSFPRMDLSPVLSAQALNDDVAESKAFMPADPLSVFIDGPTGYTFAWTDGAWKFVGRISD
jgi:hypothetical protein